MRAAARTKATLALALLVLAFGCRQAAPPSLAATTRCEAPAGGPTDPLGGAAASDGGVVGASHHFSRELPLPPATPVTRVRLREGSIVYEAQMIFETRTFEAPNSADLRRQFRAMVARGPAPTTTVTNRNRAAVGYERAPFVVDYTRLGLEPRPGAPGADLYPAYTRWFIETGWEDGAIVEAKAPNGDVTFRFEPSLLYANISSAMRLPEWSPDAAEMPVWHRFRCALQQHEALHIETARAVAANVLRELSGASASSPEALEKLYYFVWREGLAWGRREDDRLDAYTGHGPLL